MTDTEFLAERGNIYRLLSACFYEPERDLFLQENLCGNLKHFLEKVSPEGVGDAGKMELALQESDQQDIAVEHSTLFIGPFELLAPPYGSVYLEKGKRLMGDTTMDVQRIYAENGLELDVQEPPDHISFELEFMHYLCRLQLEALEEGEIKEAERCHDTMKDFLFNFINPWIPRFCADIRSNSKNDFYIHLADCLEHFITFETADIFSVTENDMEKDHA